MWPNFLATSSYIKLHQLKLMECGRWPSDLVYYVKNYGISLPHDFVRHMAENLWVVADVDLSNLKL